MEALTAQASADVQGRLRVSMPAAFGVRYIAPILPQFMERYPQIEIDVWCSDQFVDFTEAGFDVAIRITGTLTPSSLQEGLPWCAALPALRPRI